MVGAWSKGSCGCKATGEALVGFQRWHASLWRVCIHGRKDRFGSIPCPSWVELASLDAFDDSFRSIFARRLMSPMPKKEAAQAFATMLAFEADSWHALVIPTCTE